MRCNVCVFKPWWLHEMETISMLLALCEGNAPVTGGFPSQRASNAAFDVLFDVDPNKTVKLPVIPEALSHWRYHN